MGITVGSLFSGCGGLDLGFKNSGFDIKWHCEIDKWCNRILERHFDAPIHRDVHKLHSAEEVDVLIGGFPCQPVSAAGLKNGVDDPRWLWPAYSQAIQFLRPSFVVVENVQGLLRRGLEDVLRDLAREGYDAVWFSLRSSDVGAPHRRKRVYIIASNSNSPRRWEERGEAFGNEDETGEQKNDYLLGGSGEGEVPPAVNEETSDANIQGHNKSGTEFKLQLTVKSGETSSDSNSKYENRSLEEGERRGIESTDRNFGAYEEVIKRWELLFAPAPSSTDEKGRLSCEFVEWMMGFPENWTEGVSRTQRLKMLGNAVQVQCAEVVANLLKENIYEENHFVCRY